MAAGKVCCREERLWLSSLAVHAFPASQQLPNLEDVWWVSLLGECGCGWGVGWGWVETCSPGQGCHAPHPHCPAQLPATHVDPLCACSAASLQGLPCPSPTAQSLSSSEPCMVRAPGWEGIEWVVCGAQHGP